MEGLFGQIGSRLEDGERVFLAVVVGHTDHSPGTAGSKLALFQDGSTAGTIGGGIMERRVMDLAARALTMASFKPRREVLVHRADAEQASGLICAGQQTNIYLRLGRDDLEVVRRIANVDQAGRPPPGWLTISAAGLAVSELAPASNPSATVPRPFALESDRIGDRESSSAQPSWQYYEPLVNPRRLLILGGGHCALALSKTAREAGFHVTVADDRPNLPTLEGNQAAHRRLSVPDLSFAADQTPHAESTAVVVMGTDLASDVKSLSGALRHPFPFIGLMGAPAKISRVRKALAEDGFGPEALDRITAPVGLSIGSRTPQEIAISVTAQLIQRHRQAETEA